MLNTKNKIMALSLVLALGAGTTSSANAGWFGDHDKHDEITSIELSQVKLSLKDAIEKVQTERGGTVIEAELEKEDGQLFYEIEYLKKDNEIEVAVNAITGEITESEECKKDRKREHKRD